MNEYFNQLLIDVFSSTCDLTVTKMSFEQFFINNYEIIFKHFNIENVTQEEVDFVLNILTNSPDNYTSLKNIVYTMSLNPSLTYKEIEDYTFQAICPIISSAIEKKRLLNSLKDNNGIVVVDVSNIIVSQDLNGINAKFYIVKQQIGWNLYDYRLRFVDWFETAAHASDYCYLQDFKIKGLKILGGVVGGSLLGVVLYNLNN